mgnify:CR=1 FL=1
MPTSPRKKRNILQRADVGIGPYELFFGKDAQDPTWRLMSLS